MNHFLVNGRQIDLSASPDQPVEELIEELRQRFNNEGSVVAAIRVDGAELDPVGEAALSGMRVSEIGSVEVLTARPRELAEETLKALDEFTVHLEALSRRVSDHLGSREEMGRLIDGILTFTEGLEQVKRALRITTLEKADILEADLASILRDLADFTDSGQMDFAVDLLRNHLPFNLEEWRRTGIPAIVRSRDN